jgi:hypothetical protein
MTIQSNNIGIYGTLHHCLWISIPMICTHQRREGEEEEEEDGGT